MPPCGKARNGAPGRTVALPRTGGEAMIAVAGPTDASGMCRSSTIAAAVPTAVPETIAAAAATAASVKTAASPDGDPPEASPEDRPPAGPDCTHLTP